MRIFALLMLACVCAPSAGADFAKDFAVILATEKTEARFGKLPLDRALLAKAVEHAARGGAKGVVIKFFLDRPKDKAADGRLAQSLSLVPVILQARLDDTELVPNILAERFTLGDGLATFIQGHSAWIPLPAFADKSHDICFVDFSGSPVPLVETYKGRAVKSLLLCAVEFATGSKMTLASPGRIKVGSFNAPVDNLHQTVVKYPSESTFEFFELSALLDDKLPKDTLKGRIVIIGYDGPHIHTVPTPFGQLGAHRAFILLLKSFYESGSKH
jgi:hypothetical protein